MTARIIIILDIQYIDITKLNTVWTIFLKDCQF